MSVIIESARLRLRPPRLENFEFTAEMFTEDVVLAHIGGKPLSRADSWAKFLRDVGHWTLEQFGQFSVFERGTDEYIGKVGHARFERLPDQALTSIEMSWTLRSRFHGKGYATEAAVAAQNWFDSRGLRRAACIIAPENVRSLKLAAHLGYEEVEQILLQEKKVSLLIRDPSVRCSPL